MSEHSRHDPDRMENVEQVLSRRIQLGADEELLGLFGGDLDGGDGEFVESGRQEILARGFLVEADIDGDDSALLAVMDHGELLYPGFQFEAGSAVPLPVAAYANTLLKAGDFHPWEAAFWWISNTGLLDGKTPLEVLDANTPEAADFLRGAVEAEVAESD